MSLDGYMELKKKVEQAQQRADKAEGALDQIMKRLKNEFDCNSLEEAESKLKTLQRKEVELKEKFEEAKEEFKEKWDDRLSE